jgi:hypothetical protein
MEFNLPEDSYDLKIKMNAEGYFSVLSELDQWLRDEIKYVKYSSRTDVLQEVRDKLFNILQQENIEII